MTQTIINNSGITHSIGVNRDSIKNHTLAFRDETRHPTIVPISVLTFSNYDDALTYVRLEQEDFAANSRWMLDQTSLFRYHIQSILASTFGVFTNNPYYVRVDDHTITMYDGLYWLEEVSNTALALANRESVVEYLPEIIQRVRPPIRIICYEQIGLYFTKEEYPDLHEEISSRLVHWKMEL